MPPPDRIAALLARDIATATQRLLDGGTVARWEQAMLDAIARGHSAAGIAGASEQILRAQGRAALERWVKDRALSDQTRRMVRGAVVGQMPYLRGFTADVRAGKLSDLQIAARAALYAGATRATYYKSRNTGWDLRDVPIPADGDTPCVSNCKCVAYEEGGQWFYETTAAEHCAGCLARAAKSPYPLKRLAA